MEINCDGQFPNEAITNICSAFCSSNLYPIIFQCYHRIFQIDCCFSSVVFLAPVAPPVATAVSTVAAGATVPPGATVTTVSLRTSCSSSSRVRLGSCSNHGQQQRYLRDMVSSRWSANAYKEEELHDDFLDDWTSLNKLLWRAPQCCLYSPWLCQQYTSEYEALWWRWLTYILNKIRHLDLQKMHLPFMTLIKIL